MDEDGTGGIGVLTHGTSNVVRHDANLSGLGLVSVIGRIFGAHVRHMRTVNALGRGTTGVWEQARGAL